MKKIKSEILVGAAMVALLLTSGCRKVERLKDDIDFPAAYVINGKSNSISIINLETNDVAETADFKKGEWPHHIYANSSKDKVVISLTGMDLSGGHAGHGVAMDSYLIVLRASDLKVESFLKTDAMAHNALFMNDNTEIWMPQMEDEGVIKIFDAESLKETGSIAVGAGPLELTISSNGNYAFIANGEGNSISVIDIASKTVTKTIPVGMEPVGAWPASNNKMYVDCEMSKEIFEIDAVTLEVTDTIDLAFTPAYVNYNSSTAELWVTDTEFGGVYSYEFIAGQWVEKSYLPTGTGAHAIAFNAAGDKAYITNQEAGTVSVIDATSFTKITDITVGEKPNGILLIE